MARDAYLESLRQKHAALEVEISELCTRPHPEEFAIKRLKVQKLQLKEQIEAIEAKPVDKDAPRRSLPRGR